MPYYVKSKITGFQAYHTGNFDPGLPPDPYITQDIQDAMSWDTKADAQIWVSQFGGEVVEIPERSETTDSQDKPMDKNELIKFLKENLSIHVISWSGWGGGETKIILKINDEEISYAYLPTIPNHD